MTDNSQFMTGFSARDLRDALGHFATGVAVVSCISPDGEAHASTVSSFNSVSLDPPLVLFSLANAAKSLPDWLSARHYAVSILHANQQAISNQFAKALTDKWDGVTPVSGPRTNAPLIPNALAWFECEAYATYGGGDHTIFVGRVLSLRRRAVSDNDPLLFFAGRYQKLSRGAEGLPPREDMWLHGW